jgi:hypothetical protein
MNKQANPLKARFNKVYADLPVGLRSEVVVVIENVGPLTWNAAYIEIETGTELGTNVLNKLDKLGVI